jgi:hypothetical protein
MPEINEIATIRINPDLDTQVSLYKAEAERLLGYATARIILSDADVKAATDDLSVLARLKKAIEAKRQEYVGPINEHLKAVNNAFKSFAGPLEIADATTRQKIMGYRRAEDEKARKIEEANAMRMEAARLEAEASGTGEIQESVQLTEAPAPLPKTVTTDNGAASTVKNWHAQVVDFKLLPDEYKLPNQSMLDFLAKKISKNGVPTIPGVKFYSEETLRVNAR